jgi:hypothetical protein
LDFNATPSHGLKFRNGYKKIEWQSKNGSQRKKIIIIIMKEDNYPECSSTLIRGFPRKENKIIGDLKFL